MELKNAVNQNARAFLPELVEADFVESPEPADFKAINVEGCLSSHRFD